MAHLRQAPLTLSSSSVDRAGIGREFAALVEALDRTPPAQRLAAVAELRTVLGAVEERCVSDVLEKGWSWTKIGAALGVSKQAAHARHRRAAAKNAAPTPRGHVSTVRDVVRYAVEEASRAGCSAVDGEHLLVGILRADDRAAAQALRESGVSLTELRTLLRPGLEPPPAGPRDAQRSNGDVAPISAGARRSLERALRASANGRNGGLDVRRLLTELLSDSDGTAARTLHQLGVSPGAVLRRLSRQQP